MPNRLAPARTQGYAMLLVLMLLFLVAISVTAAIPAWKTALQRERENTEITYAKEYVTGIKRYYCRNGRYPVSTDDLMGKTGGVGSQRYLRQVFPDPLSPDGEFRYLHFGEVISAQVANPGPLAELAKFGLATSSLGSALGNGLGGVNGAGSPGGGLGLPTVGPGGGLGAAGGAPGQGPGTPGSPSAPGAPGVPGGIGGTGSGTGTTGQGGASGAPGGNGSMYSSGSNTTPIATGPIVGVVSKNDQPGVHSFNGFNKPDQWMFVYDFSQDPCISSANGRGGAGRGTGLPGVGAGGGINPLPGGGGTTPLPGGGGGTTPLPGGGGGGGGSQ